MATIPRTAQELIAYLRLLGITVWHNRGGLFAGPLAKLDPDVRALLAHFKAELIFLLKRYPLKPERPTDLIAPLPPRDGSYEGRLVRRPWHYELAIVLPHIGPADVLETAITCWRHQTVSPYILVIDTGSTGADLADVLSLRSFDLEVHCVHSHGWRHSSQPVSAALDLAFAAIQQNRALLTHTDVYPRNFTLIEELLRRCNSKSPVVGYQMSKRVGSDEWQECVSHTLTMVDMLTMRRIRATWNLLASLEQDDEVEQRFLGWPDTETNFGRACRAAGIVPDFLGPESNAHVYQTDLIVHWRSVPSVRHYLPDQAEERHPGLAAWLKETRDLGHAAELLGLRGRVPKDSDARESQPRAHRAAGDVHHQQPGEQADGEGCKSNDEAQHNAKAD